MKRLILVLALLAVAGGVASAQRQRSAYASRPDYREQWQQYDSLGIGRYSSRWAGEINVVDLGFLGTVNGDFQFALAQHWTIEAQARYNNWTYNKAKENQLESRQKTFAAGVRFWPWYTYSGWWIGLKGQYQEYNRGGIGTLETEEGDAFGGVLSAGYSLQINRWFNIDFGLGGWAGMTKYTTYACPHCGKRVDEGKKFFFLPNEVVIAAMFIF